MKVVLTLVADQDAVGVVLPPTLVEATLLTLLPVISSSCSLDLSADLTESSSLIVLSGKTSLQDIHRLLQVRPLQYLPCSWPQLGQLDLVVISMEGVILDNVGEAVAAGHHVVTLLPGDLGNGSFEPALSSVSKMSTMSLTLKNTL